MASNGGQAGGAGAGGGSWAAGADVVLVHGPGHDLVRNARTAGHEPVGG